MKKLRREVTPMIVEAIKLGKVANSTWKLFVINTRSVEVVAWFLPGSVNKAVLDMESLLGSVDKVSVYRVGLSTRDVTGDDMEVTAYLQQAPEFIGKRSVQEIKSILEEECIEYSDLLPDTSEETSLPTLLPDTSEETLDPWGIWL